jgi:hypothetical protein
MVYLPTQLGDFVQANVGKYSSTKEHLGDRIYDGCNVCALKNEFI